MVNYTLLHFKNKINVLIIEQVSPYEKEKIITKTVTTIHLLFFKLP